MTMISCTFTLITLLWAPNSATTASSQDRSGDNASVDPTRPAAREDGRSIQPQSPESDNRSATRATYHWLVLPVKTELQRLKVGTNTTVYVIVDGEYFREKRTIIDARALHLNNLRKELEPYHTSEDAAAYFYIRNIGPQKATLARHGNRLAFIDDEDYVTDLLRYTFLGLSQCMGFHDATVQPLTYRGTNAQTWDAYTMPLIREHVQNATTEENGLGNDKCKLFPVRTALSREMYFGADCVLYCVPGSGGITSTNDVQALVRYVDTLRLSTKKVLCFVKPPMSSDTRTVAQQLGFKVAIMVQ